MSNITNVINDLSQLDYESLTGQECAELMEEIEKLNTIIKQNQEDTSHFTRLNHTVLKLLRKEIKYLMLIGKKKIVLVWEVL